MYLTFIPQKVFSIANVKNQASIFKVVKSEYAIRLHFRMHEESISIYNT